LSGKIFISYRRDDKADTRWLASELMRRFGQDNVFYDQTTIQAGQMFPDVLRSAVSEAPVVLIVVGRDWEKILQERIASGISLTDDWVVREIEIALERLKQQKTAIFVLTMNRDGMREGPFDAMPESLHVLKDIQLLSFTSNQHSLWKSQFDTLVNLIKKVPGTPQPGGGEPPLPQGCLPPAREDEIGYVDRHDLIDQALQLMADDISGGLALWGLPGIGKSTLAAQIFWHTEIRRLFPDGQYWIDLGKDADSRLALIQLRKLSKCLGASVEDVGDNPEALRSSLQAHVGDRRLLFIFDDVWSEGIGKLVRIAGANCVNVFTTHQASTARALTRREKYMIEIPKLSQQDSLELVKSIVPDVFENDQDQAVRKEVAASIAQYDGLPLALSILGRQLRKAGTKPGRILRELKRFSAGDVHELFEASCRELHPDTFKSLRRLSVLKPDPDSFELDLFEQATDGTEDMADEQEDAGLIYAVGDGHTVEAETDDGERYAMHRTIADWLYAGLDPAEARAVSAKAASYFAGRLSDIEEAASDSDYDRWYRNESLAWQQAMYNLRYYLLKSGDYGKASFILTKAWIDGFWWWGCFDQFDFCDQLIENWPAALDGNGKELASDLGDLQTIKECYPKETDPDRSSKREAWLKARQSLQNLLVRRGLEGDAAAFNNDQADLRGLLDIFLAETYRFGEGDYAKAKEYYRDAVAMFSRSFEGDEDCWNLGWAQFHLADCLYEEDRKYQTGQRTEAHEICIQAIANEEAKPHGDQEVLARLYKVCADIEADDGRPDAAACAYHNAVYYAYRFQAYKDLQTPAEIDSYTARHYPETARGVIIRLCELYQRDRSLAVQIVFSVALRWHEEIDAGKTEQELERGNSETLLDVIFYPALQQELHDDAGARERFSHQVKEHLGGLAPCVLG
jgi:hypothetical protein